MIGRGKRKKVTARLSSKKKKKSICACLLGMHQFNILPGYWSNLDSESLVGD